MLSLCAFAAGADVAEEPDASTILFACPLRGLVAEASIAVVVEDVRAAENDVDMKSKPKFGNSNDPNATIHDSVRSSCGQILLETASRNGSVSWSEKLE